MTTKLIGEHWEGDVRVQWWGDDVTNTVTIVRSQDAQDALDHVAAVNSDGAQTIDGLGKPVAEVPVGAAMEFCEKRGIPWEKFLYGNEYDAEFRLFAQEHSRLAYQAKQSVFPVLH
jgi:hypothetical protein